MTEDEREKMIADMCFAALYGSQYNNICSRGWSDDEIERLRVEADAVAEWDRILREKR